LADSCHEMITAINSRQGRDRSPKGTPIWFTRLHDADNGWACLAQGDEATSAYRDIPAVAMSSLPESVVAGAADGLFSALLREPFKLAAVIDALETVLGGQSWSVRSNPCLAGITPAPARPCQPSTPRVSPAAWVGRWLLRAPSDAPSPRRACRRSERQLSRSRSRS